ALVPGIANDPTHAGGLLRPVLGSGPAAMIVPHRTSTQRPFAPPQAGRCGNVAGWGGSFGHGQEGARGIRLVESKKWWDSARRANEATAGVTAVSEPRRIPDRFEPGEIAGILWKPLKQFADARGWLVELFRDDELPVEYHPAMAYVSLTEPGIARGPHEHVDQ